MTEIWVTVRNVPGTVMLPADGSGILRPFDGREAITTKEAAALAGVSSRQVRRWSERFGIGRKVAGGDMRISRVALQMLLEGDRDALARYLDGDRGFYVLSYYENLGLLDLLRPSHPVADDGDISDIFGACAIVGLM